MKKLSGLSISLLAGLSFMIILPFNAEVHASSVNNNVSDKKADRVDKNIEATDSQQEQWQNLAVKYSSPYLSENIVHANNEIFTSAILSQWWTLMQDETLNDLIQTALTQNKDLQIARSRVNQARASLGISKATLLPWLDASGSWSRTKYSDNSPYAAQYGIYNDYKLGIDASWEIDVFGKQKENVRAASTDLQAQHAELYGTWISLSSEIALNYYSLRTLQERLSIVEDSLAEEQNSVNLLQSKYNAGLINELPLLQAKYTLKQTEAQIPELKTSIAETLTRLAILTGNTPGKLDDELSIKKPLPDINPHSFIGIPAETLRQRPDIHAAERRIAGQIARLKSAKADWLPKFSLTGTLGLESNNSGSLLSIGGSKGFNIFPQITFPLFHAGAIRRNVNLQEERITEYQAEYEQTVLEAAGEVRDVLIASEQEIQHQKSLQEGLQAAEKAKQAAQINFSHGLCDYQNVIDAQKTVLSLREQCAMSHGQEIANAIGLFKALGGGWEPLAQEEYTASQDKDKNSDKKE